MGSNAAGPIDMNSYKQSALKSSAFESIHRPMSVKGNQDELAGISRQYDNGKVQRLDRFPKEYQFPFLDGNQPVNPMVDVPFNDSLLHDYCMMLNKDNNRDINIFGIQSISTLINDAVRLIMPNAERFMSCFNLIELYTMPFEIMEGQFKII
jgi:hypothetical protein